MELINEGGQEIGGEMEPRFCLLCDDNNPNLGPYDACTCCDYDDWSEKDE